MILLPISFTAENAWQYLEVPEKVVCQILEK